MPSPPPTAEEIKAIRKQLDLTQPEFAGYLLGFTDAEIDRCRELNSMWANVKQWEQGHRQPSDKHLRLLAKRGLR